MRRHRLRDRKQARRERADPEALEVLASHDGLRRRRDLDAHARPITKQTHGRVGTTRTSTVNQQCTMLAARGTRGAGGKADQLRDAVRLEEGDELLGVLDGRLGVVRGRGRRLGVHAPREVRVHFFGEQDGLYVARRGYEHYTLRPGRG